MIGIATLALVILCGLAPSTTAGELCLLPSAANGLNVSVICDELWLYDNDWIGYRSGGGEPCQRISFIAMCLGSEFGWTISSSATDPLHNEDPLPLGTGQLYLWYYCTNSPYGLASAEFDVDGTIAVYAFTPAPGFYNIGDETHLVLGVDGCPYGPVVAGTFLVHDPIAVDAATWGRIKGTYR